MTIGQEIDNSEATDGESSSVRLVHHGAAAANSGHAVVWLGDPHADESVLVYASHCIVNFARRAVVATGRDGGGFQSSEQVWSVQQTLRSRVRGGIITCIENIGSNGIVCGFSNGTVSLWYQHKCGSTYEWMEHILIEDEQNRSITVVTAFFTEEEQLLVVSGSSGGAMFYTFGFADKTWSMLSSKALLHMPVASIMMVDFSQGSANDEVLILLGTASHRHNKIHVWHTRKQGPHEAMYSGSLPGHEDWISSLCWRRQSTTSNLLASGSQDCKIRLWKFVTRSGETTDMRGDSQNQPALQESDSGDDSEDDAYLEQEVEGESRLEICYLGTTVSVFLDALLIGHEAAVTSVVWHPNPLPIYGQDMVLISSSLDRSILLWAPSECSIWTPLTRVGSAGGILGGPISSSLLGFCSVIVEPDRGHCLVGHAYGGALHVWSLQGDVNETSADASQKTICEKTSLISWVATPGITGHFNGVTDLCWEASQGRYLLTVGDDQTCRLWSPLNCLHSKSGNEETVWLEIARPQVHGYNLSSITSVSTSRSPHRIVSGADEKEIRVFDAPLSTLRLLSSIFEDDTLLSDANSRVERAYIPSLGLSNKATAADGAEEDDVDEMLQARKVHNKLPLERDLGTESIWPEVQKLFGHQSELYCLASTCAARTSGVMYKPTCQSFLNDLLVASSTKARDVESASIRIWDMATCKCKQVLSDGHKSTVATLSFSPDGQYLISSGKDRRLCLWKRSLSSGQFSVVWAKDSAHKRIIWSVHACPFDETIFASGSRDGCINIWVIRSEADLITAALLCSFAPHYREDGKPDAVTALSFAPRRRGSDMILAVGLESGFIELWKLSIDAAKSKATAELFIAFPDRFCHSSRVSKLAWRPLRDGGVVANHTLASCSMDHGCRLFSVDLSSDE